MRSSDGPGWVWLIFVGMPLVMLIKLYHLIHRNWDDIWPIALIVLLGIVSLSIISAYKKHVRTYKLAEFFKS